MNNEVRDIIVNDFVSRVKEHFDADAKVGRKYVFKFMVKGEFFGYHLSTTGQVTQELLNAKRYTAGEHQEEQLKVIARAVTSILIDGKTDDFGTGIFSGVSRAVYKRYWTGVAVEDLFIDFEYIDESAEPHAYTFTKL